MTARFGRQADLARELGISRAAVCQAFKKHQIQTPLDGKFDLDYYGWLLKEKQNQVKSRAQRSALKQPPGIKDPRVRREVIRHLTPIWEDAVIRVMKCLADGAFETEEDLKILIGSHIVLDLFWDEFHTLCDEELNSGLTDFSFQKPKSLQIPWYQIDDWAAMESLVEDQND